MDVYVESEATLSEMEREALKRKHEARDIAPGIAARWGRLIEAIREVKSKVVDAAHVAAM